VERSAGGKRWRLRGAAADGAAAEMATHHAIPEIVARLLAQRGVGLELAAQFLSPRLRDQLPDPAHLRDMDHAVERLVRAIRDGEKIVVFGDSLSDVGNVAHLTQSAYGIRIPGLAVNYANGRFTDGIYTTPAAQRRFARARAGRAGGRHGRREARMAGFRAHLPQRNRAKIDA